MNTMNPVRMSGLPHSLQTFRAERERRKARVRSDPWPITILLCGVLGAVVLHVAPLLLL